MRVHLDAVKGRSASRIHRRNPKLNSRFQVRDESSYAETALWNSSSFLWDSNNPIEMPISMR
jgi:hypothetical protein